MNKHFTQPTTNTQLQAAALFRLAKTQKRLSWIYRNWAIEAAQEGKAAAYTKYRDEAKRLWREAKYHLAWTRRLTNG